MDIKQLNDCFCLPLCLSQFSEFKNTHSSKKKDCVVFFAGFITAFALCAFVGIVLYSMVLARNPGNESKNSHGFQQNCVQENIPGNGLVERGISRVSYRMISKKNILEIDELKILRYLG